MLVVNSVLISVDSMLYNKMENPDDDPRQYRQHGPQGPDLEADDDPAPFNPLDLFSVLLVILF